MDDLLASPTGLQLTRDEDVLDTWFSSALWPFSTLGWPDDTREVARFYPTSALVTGFDIIFFWVARMMMMGTHFMKEVPFHDVYIHGLVRDAQGNKMSKTRGNVIDPLDIIDGIDLPALIAKRTAGLNKEAANRVEKEIREEYPDGIKPYGTDALRFTMAAMAAQGSDVKLSIERIEGYRNFATKVWNAARFAEQNECVRDMDFDPKSVTHTLNRWIVGETERAATAVTAALEAYKFNEAAGAVYEFIWDEFCDWYLELIKPILAGDDEIAQARNACFGGLGPRSVPEAAASLHALHHRRAVDAHGRARRRPPQPADGEHLADAQGPRRQGSGRRDRLGGEAHLRRALGQKRDERPGRRQDPAGHFRRRRGTIARARTHEETIKRLARLDSITFSQSPPKLSALIVIGEATMALPLEGVIDMDAERKRLTKEIDKAESDLTKAQAFLANEANVAKSPEHVVGPQSRACRRRQRPHRTPQGCSEAHRSLIFFFFFFFSQLRVFKAEACCLAPPPPLPLSLPPPPPPPPPPPLFPPSSPLPSHPPPPSCPSPPPPRHGT